MNVQKVQDNTIPPSVASVALRITLGGALAFAIGYFTGKTAGAPITGGIIWGTAGAAQSAFQIFVNESAKKNNWEFTATTMAKGFVSHLANIAGRIGLIALNILHPGKATAAVIWTGVGLISGIAQLCLTLAIHKIAEANDWCYSSVLLGQCCLTALGDLASTITLLAVGILAPSSAGLAVAITIPLVLTAITIYNALLLKYSGMDIPFRKVLIEKFDPLTTLYKSSPSK